MTLKQTRNLGARQATKINHSSLQKILARKKVNPTFIRTVFLNTRDIYNLELIRQYFYRTIKVEDLRAMRFLNRHVSEKFNPSVISRRIILQVLYPFAEKGDARVIRGALVGMKDSDEINRFEALRSLRELAKHGEGRTVPGLIIGLKDSNSHNRYIALEGLRDLAEKGNAQAQKALEELGK
jgi:hypothetical protein